MPALKPELIIFTDAAYPAKNFEPVSNTGGIASYQQSLDSDQPVALAATMTISLQKPTKTSRISKARIKLVIPYPVMVNDVATAAKDHENSIDLIMMSSERSLTGERQEILRTLQAFLEQQVALDVLCDLKSIY